MRACAYINIYIYWSAALLYFILTLQLPCQWSIPAECIHVQPEFTGTDDKNIIKSMLSYPWNPSLAHYERLLQHDQYSRVIFVFLLVCETDKYYSIALLTVVIHLFYLPPRSRCSPAKWPEMSIQWAGSCFTNLRQGFNAIFKSLLTFLCLRQIETTKKPSWMHT